MRRCFQSDINCNLSLILNASWFCPALNSSVDSCLSVDKLKSRLDECSHNHWNQRPLSIFWWLFFHVHSMTAVQYHYEETTFGWVSPTDNISVQILGARTRDTTRPPRGSGSTHFTQEGASFEQSAKTISYTSQPVPWQSRMESGVILRGWRPHPRLHASAGRTPRRCWSEPMLLQTGGREGEVPSSNFICFQNTPVHFPALYHLRVGKSW